MTPQESLNSQQQIVCRLVSQGLKNKEIATFVNSTENRIKQLLVSIYDKVGVDTRLELALWWVQKGQWMYGQKIQNSV